MEFEGSCNSGPRAVIEPEIAAMLPAQQLAAIQPHTEVGGAPIPLSEGLGAGLHQFLG